MTTIHAPRPPLEIDGLTKDLKDNATPTSLPHFDVSKFQVEYLQRSEVRQAIQKEVTKLSESLKTTEENFHHISIKMGELDDVELIQNKHGKPILYRPKWDEIHDKYTKLISTSKHSAVTLKAMIDELVLDFFPKIEKKEDPINAKEYLTEYIKSLERFGMERDDMTLRFTRLRQSFGEFQNKLTKEAGRELESVRDKIKKIDEQIKQLEENATTNSATDPGIKSPSTFEGKDTAAVSIATVAGANTLFKIAPEVEAGMMIATLKKLDLGRVANAKEILKNQTSTNEVTDLKIQREAIRLFDEELQFVVGCVEKLGPRFEGMIGKLANIYEVYQMILQDCGMIGVHLSGIEGFKSKQRFEDLMNLIKATYATFSSALESYCLSIE